MSDRLVLVYWQDAIQGSRTGWRPISEMRKSGSPAPAQSVGWLIRENDESITVLPHRVGESMEDGDGEIVIPKGWVERIVDLAQVKRGRK